MKTILIHANDSGQRLDRFLRKAFPELPVSMIHKGCRKKQIKCNQKRCAGDTRLSEGDVLTLYLPDAVLQPAQKTTTPISAAAASRTPLSVVYEDTQLLIVYKPVGVLSQSDTAGDAQCLVAQIQAYLQETGEYHPEAEQSFSPAICNRLDRNTEGLVIAAKTAAALRELNRLIRENRIRKTYLCIVSPPPKPASALLRGYHRKDAKTNMVSVFDTPQKDTREILTEYKTLQVRQELALMEITLHTGRTHQIRVHMQHIGSPLLGDSKYGNSALNQKYHCRSQLLCAYRLTFNPEDASPLAYLQKKIISAPLPFFADRFFPADAAPEAKSNRIPSATQKENLPHGRGKKDPPSTNYQRKKAKKSS